MTSVVFKRVVSGLILGLAITAVGLAQTSASLSGSVQDPKGQAVAGAKVTAADQTKNIRMDATTGADGTFSFAVLQPGTYTVTIEASGFKKSVQTGIVINASDRQ